MSVWRGSGKPTQREAETAIGVLAYMSEHLADGATRDEIGHVIDLLDGYATYVNPPEGSGR